MIPFRSVGPALVALLLMTGPTVADPPRHTDTSKRIKAALDALPPIDAHDHLWPFEKLAAIVKTDHGKGVNLASP